MEKFSSIIILALVVCLFCFYIGNPITVLAADDEPTWLEKIWDSITDFFNNFKISFTNKIQNISTNVQSMRASIATLANNIGNQFRGALSSFFSRINSIIVPIQNALSTFRTNFVEKIGDLRNVLAGVLTNLKNFQGDVHNVLSGILDNIKLKFDSLRDVGVGILDTLKSKLLSVVNLLTSARDNISLGFTNLSNNLVTFFRTAIDDIVDFFTPDLGVGNDRGVVGGLLSRARSKVDTLFIKITNIVLEFRESIGAVSAIFTGFTTIPLFENMLSFSFLMGLVPLVFGGVQLIIKKAGE